MKIIPFKKIIQFMHYIFIYSPYISGPEVVKLTLTGIAALGMMPRTCTWYTRKIGVFVNIVYIFSLNVATSKLKHKYQIQGLHRIYSPRWLHSKPQL